MFGWFRRTRAGDTVPRKREDNGYQQKAEKAVAAALSGDLREEYLAALAERSELLKEFGDTWIYECTRDFTQRDPVLLSPEEIRERTAQLRRTFIAGRDTPSALRTQQRRPAITT
ncbi:hypothetical protein [Rhodococcus opacus]|uniref:hypothetical protein n=1 Tax=Rhodococcus opacus TaxID=37919 RepID=UPI0024769E7B|nr:hypothetical protein [Rhodococcus opacus]MDH6293163.1 hypothetical protein [Rhodococcus opacus]